MIYENNDVENGLQRILFPVGEVAVYAETKPGRRDRIPRKKALINEDTGKILSVVSDKYKVLHNRVALELARKCCMAAFPNTTLAGWKVFSVEAPLTGGHCRIDLKHEREIAGYDWSFTKDEQNEFGPFIRVNNSYNKTSAFVISFGLVRWVCTNGMIDWHSSITIKIAHDVKEMEKSIETEINEAKFRKIFDDFRNVLEPLWHVQIPKSRFRPLMRSVLEIQEPEDMSEDRERDWECFEDHLDRVVSRYISEMGQTGYALVNAITDIASHPPLEVYGYNFIRRERHSLQRLTGIWLEDFSKIMLQPQLLAAYLAKPCLETLRPASS